MNRLLQLLVTAALTSLAPAGSLRSESTPPQPARSIADLVDRLTPRLVQVLVERKEDERYVPSAEQLRGLSNEDKESLKSYFTRPPGPVSGFLLESDLILTSLYNVAGDLERLAVRLTDGSEHVAELVARDLVDDLALLRIEKPPARTKRLRAVSWAPKESCTTGRFVVAVGIAPEGGSPTATLGIVSAPARNGGRAFQTDAAMNYGNTGGPIVDLEGRVVGISTFVGHTFPHWGMNSGIGFGVRADTIRSALPKLRAGQDLLRMPRPVLGVFPSRQQSRDPGARVGRVVEGSGAAKAGVESNDVIIEFSGVKVEDFAHLRHLIVRHKPGERIAVKVRRGKETLELTIELGSVEDVE